MEFLFDLGWAPFFLQQLGEEDLAFSPARVVIKQKGLYRVAGEFGEGWAVLSGRLRHDTLDEADLPAVGDWVLIHETPEADRLVIHKVLERKSVVARGQSDASRRRPGGTWRQVLAANVDIVFIAESLTGAVSLNRIERYLALAHDGGAWPVVLLTKADLAEEPEPILDRVRRRIPRVEAIPVSGRSGLGLDRVTACFEPGWTAVILGPSGVGKSTLINRLLGTDVQAVKNVRERDDKGRHTTTAQQLFRLPGRGLIIDTPGLRAVGLTDDEAGLRNAFDDISGLSTACRFKDCRHVSEPGCAVRSAVEKGRLDRDRYEHYLTLVREAESLAVRSDPEAARKEGRRMAGMISEVKKFDKRKFSN